MDVQNDFPTVKSVLPLKKKRGTTRRFPRLGYSRTHNKQNQEIWADGY